MNKFKSSKLVILLLSWGAIIQPAYAEDRLVQIRVDGLACSYCAYGIEKKLMKLKGVKHVDIDLPNGLVLVTGSDDLKLDPEKLRQLFEDAGFTFRAIVQDDGLKAQ
jgi:copper chaperone CopZ